VISTLLVSGDDDRDTDRRHGAYVSGKEIRKWTLIAAGALLVGYYVAYRPLRENADWVNAKNNLLDIGGALGLYIAANNDGLPPVTIQGMKGANGEPVTWANTLLEYMRHKDAFRNPANPKAGNTPMTYVAPNGGSEGLELSYGLLSSVDTARKYEIRDATILVAPTIGQGLFGSYDPLPLGGPDGYSIGYDNSNTSPNGQSFRVTRLAYTGQGDAKISVHGERGLACLRADGSVTYLHAYEEASRVKQGNVAASPWVPN
jgi:hypothetical protein